jgi:hypothetical protein
MTTATRDGRRLRIEVDGLERPFLIDPIAAYRGRYLTDLFILGALGQLTGAQAEAIFIESLGPANYARAAGFYVEQYGDGEDDRGRYVCTWGPEGRLDDAPAREDLRPAEEGDETPSLFGLRYVARTPLPPELVNPDDTLRQEEVEELALLAFYWQTVAGMEAVEAFLAEEDGISGSVKAMTLLQSRLAISPSRTSRRSGSASRTQQGGSDGTSIRNGGRTLAAVPAMKHSPEPEPAPRGGVGAWFRRASH